MGCLSVAFYAFVLNLSVGGGELFDRIIDENYKLMELDAVVFIRQICEGVQHMHKMYILHLDLKVTKSLVFFGYTFLQFNQNFLVEVMCFVVNFSQKIFCAWTEPQIRSKSSTLVLLGCKYEHLLQFYWQFYWLL